MHKNFRYPNFSQTPTGSPKSFFGTVKQIIFDWKVLPVPFFYPQRFSTPEIGETIEGSLAKVCGGELWCSLNLPPPSYPWLFSIPKFFFKHRTVPLRNVSEVSNKQFRWRTVMPVPFRILNIFGYRNFLKQRKVPLRNNRYCETKFFDGQSW